MGRGPIGKSAFAVAAEGEKARSAAAEEEAAAAAAAAAADDEVELEAGGNAAVHHDRQVGGALRLRLQV